MEEKHIGPSRGLVPGQKKVLSLLAAYQKGSVVSRTIINNREGTVTIFAFDEGEGLSEHTAPFDALVHILEGRAEIKISGKTSIIEQGEAIILPAGRPHAVKALSRFKMLLTIIRTM